MIDAGQRWAADEWFLERGLPAVSAARTPGPAAVAPIRARAGGVRGVDGQLHPGRLDQRQACDRHQRSADAGRVVRAWRCWCWCYRWRVGRLAGVAHHDTERPDRRGDRVVGDRGSRRCLRRPELTPGSPISCWWASRSQSSWCSPHLEWARSSASAAQTTMSHLAEAGSLLLRALTGAVADIPGLLQFPGVADGIHGVPAPVVACDPVPRCIAASFVMSVTVDRVQPMLNTTEPAADRASATDRHAVRNDAGRRSEGQGAQSRSSGSTCTSCSPYRSWHTSSWSP